MPTKAEQAQRNRRIADPEWYREQLKALIASCDDNIKEDSEMAEQAPSDERAKYEARVEADQHFKRSLERVLRGQTFAEALAEGLKKGARRAG